MKVSLLENLIFIEFFLSYTFLLPICIEACSNCENACCGGNCCSNEQNCCGDGSCCTENCCGDSCCSSDENCCEKSCCPLNETCCGGEYCCKQDCCGNSCCETGMICENEICVCPKPFCSLNSCGNIMNACGNSVECGNCSSGYVCDNNVCSVITCSTRDGHLLISGQKTTLFSSGNVECGACSSSIVSCNLGKLSNSNFTYYECNSGQCKPDHVCFNNTCTFRNSSTANSVTPGQNTTLFSTATLNMEHAPLKLLLAALEYLVIIALNF